MSGKSRRWLAGCGIGCGVVVVLVIVGVVGGSFMMMGDFKDAIGDRETLDQRYGGQGDFVPAADGAIPPERMEAFLAVRDSVMTFCDDFMATSAQFERMDALDEDAPKVEALSGVAGLTGEIFMMVPRMGRFFGARNGMLLEVGMGLGEYTYIYVLAYGDRLRGDGVAPESDFFSSGDPNARVCGVLRGMVRNQLDAAVDADTRALLEAEIGRLEADPRRIPWQDGLPPNVAASIAPYRERLDAVFCPATVGLELNKNRQRGLSIHGS